MIKWKTAIEFKVKTSGVAARFHCNELSYRLGIDDVITVVQ